MRFAVIKNCELQFSSYPTYFLPLVLENTRDRLTRREMKLLRPTDLFYSDTFHF
jgi:hypothetical protein